MQLDYNQALELINSAIEDNRTELEICGLRSEKLPNEIGKLATLQSLILSCCYELTFLPEDFQNLKNLESMQISNCDSLSLQSDFFSLLPNLKKLVIKDCKSVDIGDCFNNLQNLEELVLSTDLQEIPSQIGNLKKLKSLWISGYYIQKVPYELGYLTMLEDLSIADSKKLLSLPDSIGSMINLKKLYLRGLGITRLMPSIKGLVQLEELHLDESNIECLPEDFGSLSSLRECVIVKSQIRELPENLNDLSNLKVLDLRLNPICNLPDTICNLKSLEDLFVSDGQLTNLTHNLFKVTSLKRLVIDGNKLTELPSEIENLINLEVLNVRSNKLTAVPKEICNLKKLKHLDLRNNNITNYPSKIKRVEYLAINREKSYFEKLLYAVKMPEKALSKDIQKLRKKSWIPVVEHGDSDILSSKFSGIPYLDSNETWPLCGICKKPMQLFIQINFNSIPKELQNNWQMDKGILQMFYCTNEEPICCEVQKLERGAFGVNSLTRVVFPNNTIVKPTVPDELELYPSKRILSWKETFDFPDPQEIETMNIALKIGKTKYLPFDLIESYTSVDIDSESVIIALVKKLFGINYPLEYEDELASEVIREVLKRPLDREKLSGWPRWVQDVDYPKCPLCGKEMRFIFQIDSNINIPYVFGDYGCGHITQCVDHREVFGFKYASH